MITLLRKVRKRLINKGNFSSYLFYAIGEVLLVVIGILIALQINNWNQSRQENQALKVQLHSLAVDLKDNQDKLDTIKVFSNFKYHSLQYLLRMAGEESYNPEVDELELPLLEPNYIWQEPIPDYFDKAFIELAFLWSHRVGDIKMNQSTINELKSTGMYSRINNVDLRKQLDDFHDSWNWIFRAVIYELTEAWQQSLESDGLITSEVYQLEDPLDLLRNHPVRITRLKRLIREVGWFAYNSVTLHQEAEELIQMIEKEMDSL